MEKIKTYLVLFVLLFDYTKPIFAGTNRENKTTIPQRLGKIPRYNDLAEIKPLRFCGAKWCNPKLTDEDLAEQKKSMAIRARKVIVKGLFRDFDSVRRYTLEAIEELRALDREEIDTSDAEEDEKDPVDEDLELGVLRDDDLVGQIPPAASLVRTLSVSSIDTVAYEEISEYYIRDGFFTEKGAKKLEKIIGRKILAAHARSNYINSFALILYFIMYYSMAGLTNNVMLGLNVGSFVSTLVYNLIAIGGLYYLYVALFKLNDFLTMIYEVGPRTKVDILEKNLSSITSDWRDFEGSVTTVDKIWKIAVKTQKTEKKLSLWQRTKLRIKTDLPWVQRSIPDSVSDFADVIFAIGQPYEHESEDGSIHDGVGRLVK